MSTKVLFENLAAIILFWLMSLGIVWASINHFAIYLVSLKREETNLVFFWFKKRCNMTRISIMKREYGILGWELKMGKKGGQKNTPKYPLKTHTLSPGQFAQGWERGVHRLKGPGFHSGQEHGPQLGAPRPAQVRARVGGDQWMCPSHTDVSLQPPGEDLK